MARCPRLSLNRPRHRRSRWVGAAVLIVGIHVSGVAIGMMKWEDPAEMPAMPPAVMLQLEQTPPPPQKQPDPEIDIPDSEIPPQPELSEFLPPPPPEVEPVVQMAPKVEKKKEEPKKVVEKKKERKKEKKKEKKKEVAKKEKKEPSKDIPPPAHDKDFNTATDAPSKTTEEVEAPAQQASTGAAGAAGDSAGQAANALAAQVNWEGLLAAHLEKHKKYPRAAQRRNQQGSPTVTFKMDRAGNVLEANLAGSSGFDSLDEAAIDAFHRASPVPPLPAEMEGAVRSWTIRLDFTLKD